MRTPIIYLGWLLVAGRALAREPMGDRAPGRATDLEAVKAQWQSLMTEAAQTGDTRHAQAAAEQLIEEALRSKGGFARHFGGALELDVTQESIGKVIRLATVTGNPAQRVGYLRELKYLNGIARNGRFAIEGNSVTQVTGRGRVEFDAILRHRQTGATVRMEIKEVDLRSADLGKLKKQIERLGAAAREDGVRQIWVNRKSIPPAMRPDFAAFAEGHGVSIYDGISTGQMAGAGRTLAAVLEAEDAVALAGAKWPATVPVAATNFGVWAGRAGVAVSAGVVAYRAYEWKTGKISGREFAGVAAGTAAATGGAWLGAEEGAALGAALGTCVVPGVGTAVGGFVGGLAGGLGGGWIAYQASQKAVDCVAGPPAAEAPSDTTLDGAQQEALLQILQAHYAGR